MKPTRICTFEHDGELLAIVEARYADDNTAILIEVAETNEPYATLSVNIPDAPLPNNDYFYVNTWSENAMIADAVRALPIFTNTGVKVPTGFVSAEVWRFTESLAPY